MTRDEAKKIIIADRLKVMQECVLFAMEECEGENCWECGKHNAYSMALDALSEVEDD